jgi:hypothetical protein
MSGRFPPGSARHNRIPQSSSAAETRSSRCRLGQALPVVKSALSQRVTETHRAWYPLVSHAGLDARIRVITGNSEGHHDLSPSLFHDGREDLARFSAVALHTRNLNGEGPRRRVEYHPFGDLPHSISPIGYVGESIGVVTATLEGRRWRRIFVGGPLSSTGVLRACTQQSAQTHDPQAHETRRAM